MADSSSPPHHLIIAQDYHNLIRHLERYIASRFDTLTEDDTQNVAQDAIVDVLERESIRVIGSDTLGVALRRLLFVIARTKAIDLIKQRANDAVSLSIMSGFEVSQPPGPTPEDLLAATVMTARIMAAALELPTDQRNCFLLLRVDELPIGDVCKITGFSAEKVGAYAGHGERTVRKKLLGV